jgi:hypothetical protein
VRCNGCWLATGHFVHGNELWVALQRELREVAWLAAIEHREETVMKTKIIFASLVGALALTNAHAQTFSVD